MGVNEQSGILARICLEGSLCRKQDPWDCARGFGVFTIDFKFKFLLKISVPSGEKKLVEVVFRWRIRDRNLGLKVYVDHEK